MIKKFFIQYRIEIITTLLLFSLALGIRLFYQKESVVNHPIRADARSYFFSALNLCRFGVYSAEQPRSDGTPPASRTDLSPGYPIFLTFFMRPNDTIPQFLNRVLKTQAIMGALTVVLTFLIARLSLSLLWAILAGVLTALSPHLIAMDGYLLTESLFTFVTVLGILMLILSWRNNQGLFTIMAGILLALSAHVRAINVIILLFLAPIYFLHARERSLSSKSILIKQLLFLLMGYAIITGAHLLFQNQMVVCGNVKQAPKNYVSSEATWGNVVRGSYPGFFDKGVRDFGKSAWRSDPKLNRMLKDKTYAFTVLKNRFLKQPLSYIKWYLGGKIFFMWHWDNVYNGDVYIYPMHRKGFHVNPLLRSIHISMHLLHWPLFLLTLAAPMILFVLWRRGTLVRESMMLLVPVLVFVYFAGILTILQPLPRYGIPVRPFAYIMSMASLSWLATYVKERLNDNKAKKGG